MPFPENMGKIIQNMNSRFLINDITNFLLSLIKLVHVYAMEIVTHNVIDSEMVDMNLIGFCFAYIVCHNISNNLLIIINAYSNLIFSSCLSSIDILVAFCDDCFCLSLSAPCTRLLNVRNKCFLSSFSSVPEQYIYTIIFSYNIQDIFVSRYEIII